jgi:subtilisin family serine protease
MKTYRVTMLKLNRPLKLISVLFLLLLQLGITSRPGLAQSPPPGQVTPGATARVIVALHTSPADGAVAAQQVEQLQADLLRDLSTEEFRLIHEFETLPGLVGEVSPAGLTALGLRPEVAAVALDLPVQAAFTPGAMLINADDVFNGFGFTGAGVNIAVLDTGLDLAHPDLKNRVVAQKCFTQGQCLPLGSNEGDNAQDENGHGTHVGGIIAGQGGSSPRGITPDAGLVAVRVLGQSGTGFTSDVLAGLDWLVANQATLRVKVINLSLGGGSYEGPCDQADANTLLYAQAVARARQAGILTLAAAGNSGQADKMMAPACVSGVVAVGNVYDSPLPQLAWPTCLDQNIQADQVVCSSNSSSALDLLAPGVLVVSTNLGGGPASKSGTSMSVPHVAGVAALILQANPNLGPADLENVLKQTGRPVTDGRSGRVTPRLDALAAVSQVTGSQQVILAGVVRLQGRTEHGGVKLFLSETPCPSPAGAPSLATTQADGRFSLTLPPGHRFQCLQASHPGYLAGQRADFKPELGSLTLPGGDVNQDGQINIFDLALIAVRYQSNDPVADINGDGRVDIFDLSMAASNYNRSGPVSDWQ